MKNKTTLVWLFIGIPLISAFIFRKSLDLGLYGDDWQHLYILWREFFVYHTKSFFDIRSYLNPYWPEYLYLGIINHFWGYSPPAYFIASLLTRIFATIALYFFSFEITKSKLAAFLASLIFLVSAAGLQTTDWVFNMNTYAGLGLLAISSTIYLKIRKLKSFNLWHYLSFIITFTLALAIVPTRMHGAMPFIILGEIFLTYIVEKQKLKLDKHLLTRVGLAILIFYVLVHFKSFGEGSYTSGRFNDSLILIKQLIQNGYHSWWLYFVATVGHLVLPDNVSLSSQVRFLQNIFPGKGSLALILILEAFISSTLLIISSRSFIKSNKIFFYPILFNLAWLLFLIILNEIDQRTSTDIFFAISLGGQFLFWAIWFYIIGRKKYSEISNALIISIFWITTLTILYWLFTPYYIIETTGRYMTMGAAGMAIFLGALTSLLIKSSLAYTHKDTAESRLLSSLYLMVPVAVLFIFISSNFQTGQNYLNILHQTRNKDLTQNTWATLVKEVPKLDPEEPSVFYFTTNNPLSLEGVLVFGFYMRAGLEWRIPVEALTPLPCTDYQQLLAYVKDGSPLQKVHGRKAAPVPLSRVFAFDFRNGVLTNITDSVRKKISKDLNLNQPL